MPASEQRYFPMNRVEGYTDAVFAIAATLLVLDLTATAFTSVQTDAQMWETLAENAPNGTAFAISFILMSALWVIHLQQFRDIARVDGVMIWINNVRLLFIVLVPFTTSLNAELSRFTAGRMLLPINFFLAALVGYVSWVWAASRGGHLLKQEVQDDEQRGQNLGGLMAVVCGAIVVVVSPWIGSLGFLVYLLSPPVELALRRRSGRRTPTRG